MQATIVKLLNKEKSSLNLVLCGEITLKPGRRQVLYKQAIPEGHRRERAC